MNQTTTTLAELLDEYDEYQRERQQLYEREDSADTPRSSEWERSDDWAFELLERLAEAARQEVSR